MSRIILWGMLGLYTVEDIRKKRISVRYMWIFGAAGIAINLFQKSISVPDMLWGAAVGAVLVALSLLTRGSIGLGDGFLLMTAGVFLGGGRVLELLFISLLYAAFISLVMMVFRKWKRKREIPFVPFLLLGYLTMTAAGI